MKKFKLSAVSKALVAGLAFAAVSAGAQTAPFGAQFTVTPPAPWSPFAATAVDYSYRADVTQTALSPTTASFVEHGVGFFSTFQNPLSAPVGGTGLNAGAPNGYKLYAIFDGVGTVGVNSGGGLDGSFTSFTLDIFLDTARDTDYVGTTTALTGTAGDTKVATGTLVTSQFRVFPSLANGDFDVVLNLTPLTSFFSGSAFAAGVALADFNGVNSFVSGFTVPFQGTQTGRILGSGNLSVAAIPEPETYALMLAGLGAVGWIARRRKRVN